MEQKLADKVLPAAKNDPDDIKIRRYRDTLVTGGLAIIAFGIWTLIRSVLEVSKMFGTVMNGMTYKGLSEADTETLKEMVSDKTLLYGTIGILVVILLVDLIVRIYVGLNARATGLQKRKKNGKERNGIVWLIFGVFLVALEVYSLADSLISANITLANHSILFFVIQLFVEATSLFITAELVIKGILLRRLTKK